MQHEVDTHEFSHPAEINMILPIIYGVISVLSIYIFYVLGSYRGSIFTDSIFAGKTYQPFLALLILVIAFPIFSKKPIFQVYIVGILIMAYSYLTIATFPNFGLLLFPLISLILSLMMAYKIDLNRKSKFSRIVMFIGFSWFMLIIGGALRFAFNPPEYSLIFGSIYDDENPLGVPLLFYNGIVIYGRYLVVTVSIPIILLFTGLSAVLSENYYLIVKYASSRRTSRLGKNVNNALTVLSCQCEGITASFPSIVATILFSTVIPLISLSIFLLLMTNILLSRFFMRNKRVRFLDRIWHIPSRNHFIMLVAVFLPVEIFLVSISVYFGFFKNLTIFSVLNLSMFINGVFIYYSFFKIFSPTIHIKHHTEYLIIGASTIMMFIWYIPVLTTYSVTIETYFILMNITTLISGVLSGFLFHSISEKHKLLYFQYLTMMVSTLGIVIFYISAISLYVVWPYFGMTEQIEFSLIIWGTSLPFVWLSTNISLNSEYKSPSSENLYTSITTNVKA